MAWPFSSTNPEQKETVIVSPGLKEKGYALISPIRKLQEIVSTRLEESGKGRIDPTESDKFVAQLIRRGIGDPHPEKYSENEVVIRNHPLVAAQVDTTVDFIMRGGVHFESSEDNADEIVDTMKEWAETIGFDLLLRKAIRQMLGYGNTYAEIVANNGEFPTLKLWSPKHIYIKRKEDGTVENFSQWFGKGEPVIFKPSEMMHVPLNQLSDEAYGLSFIAPMMINLERMAKIERHMETILRRKANAPLIAYLGKDGYPAPAQGDIDSFTNDMQTMKDDTEWAVTNLVKFEAIGFEGKVMNFDPFVRYFNDQLMIGGRVPDVLLGKGNIAEGLAKYQTEMFEGRAKSIQELLEKPLEQQVFPLVLAARGIEGKVELKWGQAPQEDKNQEVQTLMNLMSNIGSPDAIRVAAAKRVATLLDLDVEVPDAPPNPQDSNPNQPPEKDASEPKKPEPEDAMAHEKKQVKEGATMFEFTPMLTNAVVTPPLENQFIRQLREMNNRTRSNVLALVEAQYRSRKKVKEALDEKTYNKVLQQISDMLDGDYNRAKEIVKAFIERGYVAGMETADRRLRQNREIRIGEFERDVIRMLKASTLSYISGTTDDQRKAIAFRLQQGILGGESITEIRNSIGEVFDVANSRLETIARTETVRAVAEGELQSYRDLGVEKVEWRTASDERVEELCMSREGNIYTLEEARGLLPLHPNCRCDLIPVEEEQ